MRRVLPKGFGEDNPIASNKTNKGRSRAIPSVSSDGTKAHTCETPGASDGTKTHTCETDGVPRILRGEMIILEREE
jgi:hypothetical protein